MREERSQRFNLMLSRSEHRMLVELAEGRGLTAADVMRQLLRTAYREFTADRPITKAARGKGK